MFNLDDHQAKLLKMGTFHERRGDETSRGIALKLETAIAADQLRAFDKGLPGYLFSNGAPRFPEMGKLSWDAELIGATVTIDGTDLHGERAMTLEANVDKFRIEPIQGGAATISMRVKIQPSPEQVAILYQLEKGDVQLTVTPPKAGSRKPKGDLADQAEGKRPDGKPDGWPFPPSPDGSEQQQTTEAEA